MKRILPILLVMILLFTVVFSTTALDLDISTTDIDFILSVAKSGGDAKPFGVAFQEAYNEGEVANEALVLNGPAYEIWAYASKEYKKFKKPDPKVIETLAAKNYLFFAVILQCYDKINVDDINLVLLQGDEIIEPTEIEYIGPGIYDGFYTLALRGYWKSNAFNPVVPTQVGFARCNEQKIWDVDLNSFQ